MPAPDALLAAVAAVAAEAGALALRRQGEGFRRWEKGPGQPVCEVDLEVDALIAARLAAIDPDAGWLSEETLDSPARLACERVWVVDPIDGTRDYLRGRTGWCVSIALVSGGRPVLGVLDAPGRGERWAAVAGGGATCNGRRLAASTRMTLEGARVPADTLPRTDKDLVAVPRPNSIALRAAMVAADEVDLLATLRWGNEWDIAAAALIAEEAGATVTDALGAAIRYNSASASAFGILAAAPAIHSAAIERLSERAAAALAR
ncbi:MAG: 3'(2'),5'-bisphosphate nucleotidase CysQ [Sphingomonas fennica]